MFSRDLIAESAYGVAFLALREQPKSGPCGAGNRPGRFRRRRNGGESRCAPRRSVPLKKLNFQFHIKFEFAVKAKAAESLVPSNDSAAFLFAAFSMQHRQTAFLSKRLFYLCRQEQSKVEQHDHCCDCSHDQQKHLLHKHILSRRFYLLMNLISYSSKLYTLPKKPRKIVSALLRALSSKPFATASFSAF